MYGYLNGGDSESRFDTSESNFDITSEVHSSGFREQENFEENDQNFKDLYGDYSNLFKSSNLVREDNIEDKENQRNLGNVQRSQNPKNQKFSFSSPKKVLNPSNLENSSRKSSLKKTLKKSSVSIDMVSHASGIEQSYASMSNISFK